MWSEVGFALEILLFCALVAIIPAIILTVFSPEDPQADALSLPVEEPQPTASPTLGERLQEEPHFLYAAITLGVLVITWYAGAVLAKRPGGPL